MACATDLFISNRRHVVDTSLWGTFMSRNIYLTAISVLALANATAARAADEADAVADDASTIVVTADRVARANNVVDKATIDALSGGENIVNALRTVPGVQIRGSDAFNADPWSYGINIRGFEVNLRNSKLKFPPDMGGSRMVYQKVV